MVALAEISLSVLSPTIPLVLSDKCSWKPPKPGLVVSFLLAILVEVWLSPLGFWGVSEEKTLAPKTLFELITEVVFHVGDL